MAHLAGWKRLAARQFVRVYDLISDAGRPTTTHLESIGGGTGQVQNTPTDKRTTVIDSDENTAARALVFDSKKGPKRQRAMRHRHRVVIVAFARGCPAAMERASVIARHSATHSALGPASTGGDDLLRGGRTAISSGLGWHWTSGSQPEGGDQQNPTVHMETGG